ncbi:MAG: curli assembly protein CsgG [Chthoniobacteraceae bacterium]|nr:curli assembly protein CsgG [Chthoniobacteraceae bacterium]
MKKLFLRIPSFIAGFFGAFSVMADEVPKAPLTVAIFEFQGADDASREIAPKLSTLMGVDFSVDPRFFPVERAELDKALGEQELGLSGTISEASAARTGQLTGAKLLISGRVMKIGQNTVVVAKVIGTETSRVFAEKITITPADSPVEAVSNLAKKLAALSVKNETALLGAGIDPASRLAALKQALEGKPRHAVSVTIPEQHIGRPVIDPAAETELGLLLKECGFTLVDGKSTAKPEVEITGEAFSERALQKGGLFSCKARLEIKVRRVSDGAILAADRQVSVAVDLAEHIAGKRALEMAAREIAARILPATAN